VIRSLQRPTHAATWASIASGPSLPRPTERTPHLNTAASVSTGAASAFALGGFVIGLAILALYIWLFVVAIQFMRVLTQAAKRYLEVTPPPPRQFMQPPSSAYDPRLRGTDPGTEHA